jgi:hypothetical protein
MKVKNDKDFFSGITFFTISSFFLLKSLDYELGTISEMGPAFFPIVFSAILFFFSIILIVRSIKWK